jgi:hypothetical protein
MSQFIAGMAAPTFGDSGTDEIGAALSLGTRAAPIFTAHSFPHKLTIVHYPAIQSFDPTGYRGLADDHKP